MIIEPASKVADMKIPVGNMARNESTFNKKAFREDLEASGPSPVKPQSRANPYSNNRTDSIVVTPASPSKSKLKVVGSDDEDSKRAIAKIIPSDQSIDEDPEHWTQDYQKELVQEAVQIGKSAANPYQNSKEDDFWQDYDFQQEKTKIRQKPNQNSKNLDVTQSSLWDQAQGKLGAVTDSASRFTPKATDSQYSASSKKNGELNSFVSQSRHSTANQLLFESQKADPRAHKAANIAESNFRQNDSLDYSKTLGKSGLAKHVNNYDSHAAAPQQMSESTRPKIGNLFGSKQHDSRIEQPGRSVPKGGNEFAFEDELEDEWGSGRGKRGAGVQGSKPQSSVQPKGPGTQSGGKGGGTQKEKDPYEDEDYSDEFVEDGGAGGDSFGDEWDDMNPRPKEAMVAKVERPAHPHEKGGKNIPLQDFDDSF